MNYGPLNKLISGTICPFGKGMLPGNYETLKVDDLAESLLERHPGESRGPEHLELTGFRLSPE
jgi:hypothetical protein